jgi:peptide deformylase
LAVRDIKIWPHPVLDTPAKAVAEIDESIHTLSDDLIDTCEEIGGIGLAAPQIGVGLQVFVLNVGMATGTQQGYEIFINPVQMLSQGEDLMEEGCLSLPGIKAKIKRAERYGIEYTTIEGNREEMASGGLLGQALQHEMDHLAGEVMVKRMSRLKRPRVRQKMKILKRRMKAEGVTYHDVIRSPSEQ